MDLTETIQKLQDERARIDVALASLEAVQNGGEQLRRPRGRPRGSKSKAKAEEIRAASDGGAA